MSNFHINQKLVCVNAWGTSALKEGAVYCVSSIIRGCNCDPAWVELDGVAMEGTTGYTRCRQCNYRVRGNWWSPKRFRPLDTLTETMDRIESEGSPLEHQHA